MKKILIIILLVNSHFLLAQKNSSLTREERSVMKTIDQLFDGMRKGDSSMVSSVFKEPARMLSIGEKEGNSFLFEGSLEKFLTAVGTPHNEVWDERIWDPKINIDGHMATAWVNYTFYLGDKLSHCGVNAFQLFNEKGDWKIINLTDTRQTGNCKEVPSGK